MCKLQWLANYHAGVNHKPLTEGDYEKLVDAVESVQSATQEDLSDEAPIDWQAVADIAGVSPALLLLLLLLLLLVSFHICRRQDGRIAVDCFKAYRSGGGAKTARLKWTEAVVNELLEAAKKYGTNDWGAGTPSHCTYRTHPPTQGTHPPKQWLTQCRQAFRGIRSGSGTACSHRPRRRDHGQPGRTGSWSALWAMRTHSRCRGCRSQRLFRGGTANSVEIGMSRYECPPFPFPLPPLFIVSSSAY
jgi:hypothetical protein